MTLSVQLIF